MSAPDWLMWEAKAADGCEEALLAWALAHAPAGAQVYRSQDRVVLIAPAAVADIPDPPAALITRPAYAWPFVRVR